MAPTRKGEGLGKGGIAMGRWFSVVVLAAGCIRIMTVTPTNYASQPPPDALSYMTAADSLAHGHGYRVTVPGEPDLPRYPPGLPIVLTVGVITGGFPWGAQALSQIISVALLMTVWITTRRLGGDRAAAVATGALAVSPWIAASGRVVMADAFGALLTIAALLAISHGRHLLAGVLSGYAVAVRLSAMVGAVALTRSRRALTGFGLVVVCLVVFQWVTLGSPAGGYGNDAQFGGSYVLSTGQQSDGPWVVDDDLTRPYALEVNGTATDPNVVFYPVALLLRWAILPPLVGIVGIVELWRRRHTELGRWALLMISANLILFLPYYFQSVRFVAPAGCLLAVFTGLGVARTEHPTVAI